MFHRKEKDSGPSHPCEEARVHDASAEHPQPITLPHTEQRREMVKLLEEGVRARRDGKLAVAVYHFEDLRNRCQSFSAVMPQLPALCASFLSSIYLEDMRYHDAYACASWGLQLSKNDSLKTVLPVQFLARLAHASFGLGDPEKTEEFLCELRRDSEEGDATQRQDLSSHLLILQEKCIDAMYPDLALEAGEYLLRYCSPHEGHYTRARLGYLDGKAQSLRLCGRLDEALKVAKERHTFATQFESFSLTELVHGEKVIATLTGEMGDHLVADQRLKEAVDRIVEQGGSLLEITQLQAARIEQLFEAGRLRESMSLAQSVWEGIAESLPPVLRRGLSFVSETDREELHEEMIVQLSALSPEARAGARHCLEAIKLIEEQKACVCEAAGQRVNFERSARWIATCARLLGDFAAETMSQRFLQPIDDSHVTLSLVRSRLEEELSDIAAESLDAIVTRIHIAQVCVREGDTKSAREQAERVLAALERAPLWRYSTTFTPHIADLARLFRDVDNRDTAQYLLEMEQQKYERGDRKDSLRRWKILSALADVVDAEDPSRAAELEQNAQEVKRRFGQLNGVGSNSGL